MYMNYEVGRWNVAQLLTTIEKWLILFSVKIKLNFNIKYKTKLCNMYYGSPCILEDLSINYIAQTRCKLRNIK